MISLLSVVLSGWENNFATILFNFSELLALEITKSNDVQLSVYINKMKSNLFFPWPYHFYLHV